MGAGRLQACSGRMQKKKITQAGGVGEMRRNKDIPPQRSFRCPLGRVCSSRRRLGWGGRGRGDWPDGRLIEVPVGRPPLRWTHPLAAHLGRHHCRPRAGEKEVGHWVSPAPGPRPTPGPRPHPPCAVRSASEASISPLLGRRVKGTVADLRLMSAAATMQQQCSNDAAATRRPICSTNRDKPSDYNHPFI